MTPVKQQGYLQSSNQIVYTPAAAGNMLVLLVNTSSGAGTPLITAIADTNGSSWQTLLGTASSGINAGGGGSWNSVFWLPASVAGADTITLTFNGGTPGSVSAMILEYAGMPTAAFLGGKVVGLANPGLATDAITSAPGSNINFVPALQIAAVSRAYSTAGIVPGTGFNSPLLFEGTYWAVEDRELVSTGNYSATFTDAVNGASKNYNVFSLFFLESSGTTPTISAVSAPTVSDQQTGITISGANFKATQGTGYVVISPSNSPTDAGAVTQTVEVGGWTDTAITITAVRSTLPYGSNCYVFVKNSDGNWNATGTAIAFYATAIIADTLIGPDGSPILGMTGLTAIVYKTLPTTAVAPDLVFTNASVDTSGKLSLDCSSLLLTAATPVWLALFQDGSTPLTGALKVTPVLS